jgi:anti-sigma factor RsiW
MSDQACEQARERFADYLYGEADAEAVERHLTACGVCRAELETMRRALAAVDRAGLAEAPAGVADAVVAGVLPRVRPRRRRWLKVAASAAACLAAALGLWLAVGGRGGDATEANQALVADTRAVAADAESVLRMIDELERENAALIQLLGQGGPPAPGHGKEGRS